MADLQNKVMPNNLEAEQALLGCLLMDKDIQSDILDKIETDDFYQESHQYIVEAMKGAFSQRKPVDLVTLADELEKRNTLDKMGGIAYVTELAQVTPSAANYMYYYNIVKRDSTNRKLIRAARGIADYAMKSPEESDAIAYAEKVVYDISKKFENSALTDLKSDGVVDRVIEKFEILSGDRNAFRGVETGFRKLDKLTNGLQKSDLIVIAARPGMGKTSLSMNIIEHAVMSSGKVCAVFSLEMPREQIVQRLLCSYANVSMSAALSGIPIQDTASWGRLHHAATALQEGRLYIDDSSKIDPAMMLSKLRRLKSRIGLDLVMIDYIQLMTSASYKGGAENRQQEISSITRDLKIMAKELNVPVIALSQLRRIQTKEPSLSDLRESGAIEQDADIVMFISRPDVGASEEDIASGKVKKGDAELIIAKHRNGSCDRIKLRFKGELTKFVDVEEGDKFAGGDRTAYNPPSAQGGSSSGAPVEDDSGEEAPF